MIGKTSSENDPRSECERCNGTGTFAGKGCPDCGGRGYRFTIEGKKPPARLDRPPRKSSKTSTA
jgi:hypothetical protein